MEPRITLITLGVADLVRARAFYEALGWETGAKPDDEVAFYRARGTVFALWSRELLAEDSGVEDGGGWGGVTLAHNVASPAEATLTRFNRPTGASKKPCVLPIPTSIVPPTSDNVRPAGTCRILVALPT